MCAARDFGDGDITRDRNEPASWVRVAMATRVMRWAWGRIQEDPYLGFHAFGFGTPPKISPFQASPHIQSDPSCVIAAECISPAPTCQMHG